MSVKQREIVPPTDEQQARSGFDIVDTYDALPGGMRRTIGKAYRRRPMIDTLEAKGIIDADQAKALRHYRHHADIADRSPLSDSIGKLLRRGGSGREPSVELLNAIRVRDDCEKAAGSLAVMLHRVIVDDVTLTDWAIAQGGSRERERVVRKRVDRWVEAHPRHVETAKREILVAAQRVQAELDAGY